MLASEPVDGRSRATELPCLSSCYELLTVLSDIDRDYLSCDSGHC